MVPLLMSSNFMSSLFCARGRLFALCLLLGIPLALGSLWAGLLILLSTSILIWRITDEEKLLLSNLNGYTEYCNKVRYRLIPGLY